MKNLIKIVTILTILLICSGCAGQTWFGPKHSTWNIAQKSIVCVNVPHEFEHKVKIALDAWNHSLLSWRQFVMVTGETQSCNYRISQVESPNPEYPRALAWASKVGGNSIFLVKGRYEHDVTGIVLHEMGHVLGAQHVTGTLMNATYLRPIETKLCPDLVTVAQIAAWNKLDLETLAWCL